MTDQIVLSIDTVSKLSVACKAEIAAHLGFNALVMPTQASHDGEEEFAELGLQAARAFLLGCSDRTQEVLALIVNSGDTFSLRALELQAEVGESGLRGVWAGLTKRVRTITGDGDAALIEWTPDGQDYIGRMMPVTLASFRRALEE